MANGKLSVFAILALLLSIPVVWLPAQDRDSGTDSNVFRVEVDLVQLNVAVTDAKGNYVTGLRPSDFVITEDAIAQKLATFGEGNVAPRRVADIQDLNGAPKIVPHSPAVEPGHENEGSPADLTSRLADPSGSPLAGANVFILLTRATTCIAGSCSRRMRLQILSAPSMAPIESPSIPIAAIFTGQLP